MILLDRSLEMKSVLYYFEIIVKNCQNNMGCETKNRQRKSMTVLPEVELNTEAMLNCIQIIVAIHKKYRDIFLILCLSQIKECSLSHLLSTSFD